MALTDKLTAIADAIRAKTGNTEAMTLDQMPTQIAGISAGGGSAELVYETEFAIAEVPTAQTTLATITTGLTLENDLYLCVIECTNDTLEDTANHLRLRTQPFKIDSSYVSPNVNGGWILSDNYKQIGAKVGVWVSAGGRNLATVTIMASPGSTNYGFLPTGDYSLRVYRQRLDIYGVEV